MSQDLEPTEISTPTLEPEETEPGTEVSPPERAEEAAMATSVSDETAAGVQTADAADVESAPDTDSDTAIATAADAPAVGVEAQEPHETVAEQPVPASDEATVASEEAVAATPSEALAATEVTSAEAAAATAEPEVTEAPTAEAATEAEPAPEPTTEPAAEAAAEAGPTDEPGEAPAAAEAAEPESADEPAAAPLATDAEAAAAPVASTTPAEKPATPAPPPPPVEEPPEVVALRAAKAEKTPLEGKVIGWNRGGFHVALDHGVTAFCPNSEMEIGRPREPAAYIDRAFTFHVIKVQKRGRRVVLSRRGVLADVRAERIAALRQKQAAGEAVPGRVSSITDFGAFVEVGGVEGLVHVSEISRRRVSHAREALEVGQEVAVKVLKIDQAGERVSLSMKALEPDPWADAAERYRRGAEFDGKIVRKTDFGLFIELEPDVDGLVHVSRLPPGFALDDPSLAIGESLHGWVRDADIKRRRISLSLREVPTHDPWDGAAKRYADGSVVEGTVESTAPFGAFINLEPGLTGLLPASEMQVPRGANPNRVYAPGQKVAVQVVGIDPRRKRITLAREGSKVEGSRADYQSYIKRQQSSESSGMGTMAAALSKLKEKE